MSTEGGRWSKKSQKLVNVVCEEPLERTYRMLNCNEGIPVAERGFWKVKVLKKNLYPCCLLISAVSYALQKSSSTQIINAQ